MKIEIQANSWSASVVVSDNPSDGVFHVLARTSGGSPASALVGAEFVRDVFATGRKAFLRVVPESGTETDFDTKTTRYVGFVRFSFMLEPGAWECRTHPPSLSIGEMA